MTDERKRATPAEARAVTLANGVEVRDVLRQCAEQFRFYEKSHRDKRSPDGDAKAATNQAFAEMCEAALAAQRAKAPAVGDAIERDRDVLFFACYCGDDNADCTDAAPCAACLGMSNVYRIAAGTPVTFIRELAPERNVDAPAVAGERTLTAAAADVLAERKRHTEVEGWTPEHDDAHPGGELSLAAACYALHGTVQAADALGLHPESVLWPWDDAWWKPTDRRRDLVKAGALILAEIERLDRAALAPILEDRNDR